MGIQNPTTPGATWTVSPLCALHLGSHDLSAEVWNSSITKKTQIKSNIKPPPPPETLILDVRNFDEVALVCFKVVNISNILRGLLG